MFASYEGHFAVADFLVENGANVNAQSNKGYTALILAAASGKKRYCTISIALITRMSMQLTQRGVLR